MLERLPSLHRKRQSCVLDPAIAGHSAQKYRDMLNKCLRSIGEEWNVYLALNDRGVCTFQCDRFVLSIEVPWDSKAFYLYTCVVKSSKLSIPVMRKALELNYLTQATHGSVLASDPSKSGAMEFTLCHSQAIDGITSPKLTRLVKNFLKTAISIQKQLQKADRSKLPVLPQALPSTTRGKPRTKMSIPPPVPSRLPEIEMTPTTSNKSTDRKPIPGDSPAKLPIRKNEGIKQVNAAMNHPLPKSKGLTSLQKNEAIKPHQKRSNLKEYTKMSMTLGLAMTTTAAGPKKYVIESTSKPCQQARQNDSRRSKVMRRLSRIASKTIARPRASFGRTRPSEVILRQPSQQFQL